MLELKYKQRIGDHLPEQLPANRYLDIPEFSYQSFFPSTHEVNHFLILLLILQMQQKLANKPFQG